MMIYKAFITKISNLNDDILNSLNFINWLEHVKKDSTVFIKPNFTFPYYKEGITTSPKLLRCLLGIIKDRADNVFLGESDGGNHSFSAKDAFSGHNMFDICKETGVELVNLSKIPSKFYKEKIQGKNIKVQLPKFLVENIDCFVSVPVLKIHVMTGVSIGIKNLWGCNPDTMRCLHHKHLNRKLAYMTKILDPRIVLIDGTYALDGHGPMYGRAKKNDLIISANNPVVSDALGAALMDIPLEKTKHILVAEKEGLGTTKLNKVKFNEDYNPYAMHFNINKTLIDKMSWFLFNSNVISKFVMDSSVTPLIYKMAGFLRNSEEKKLATELKRYYYM